MTVHSKEDPPVHCACGEPATWFLIDGTLSGRSRLPVEMLSASDLFEELCDTCFARAVPEVERLAWVRIAGK